MPNNLRQISNIRRGEPSLEKPMVIIEWGPGPLELVHVAEVELRARAFEAAEEHKFADLIRKARDETLKVFAEHPSS
jgi:hypothetical protein